MNLRHHISFIRIGNDTDDHDDAVAVVVVFAVLDGFVVVGDTLFMHSQTPKCDDQLTNREKKWKHYELK